MGIIRGLVHSRVQNIINQEIGLGHDLIEAFGGGRLYATTLKDFDFRSFYLAITEQGIIFIHQAKVLLSVSWGSVLSLRKYDFLEKCDLIVQLPVAREKINWVGESPFCYQHEVSFYSNRKSIEYLYEHYFGLMKQEYGIDERTLNLHQKWVECIIQADYYTDPDGNVLVDYTRDIKDAIRLLYYAGRNASIGVLPSHAIEIAQSEVESVNLKWGNRGNSLGFDLLPVQPQGDFKNLLLESKDLHTSYEKNSAWDFEEWIVGYVPASSETLYALVGENPLGYEQHRALIKFSCQKHDGSSQPWEMLIYNDFFTAFPVRNVFSSDSLKLTLKNDQSVSVFSINADEDFSIKFDVKYVDKILSLLEKN